MRQRVSRMWAGMLYGVTAAALLAQLWVEGGAGPLHACAAGALIAIAGSALLTGAGADAAVMRTTARVLLLSAPGKKVLAVLASAALGAALCARIRPPDDREHVIRLLDTHGRSAMAVSLIADVIEPPRMRAYGMSAVLEARAVEQPDGSTQAIWGRVNLSVRHASGRVRLGDRLRVRARLSRITSFHNPGEFDYARWCARRGVYVSAFVWDEDDLTVLGSSPALSRVERMRARIGQAALGHRGAAGAMTAALVVGDGSALSPEVMEEVRISGLSHLLAISGMNIGLVAAVVLWLGRSLIARTRYPASGRDPFRPVAAAAAVAVLGYSVLSGGGESVVRATVMSLLMLAAVWRGRSGDALRAMTLAALVLCVLTPGAVAEAGFQLSFAATAAILAFAEPLRRSSVPALVRPLAVAVAIGFVCWAVTAPILAYHFGRISVVAPLAGLAAALPSAVVVVAGLAAAPLLWFWPEAARVGFDLAAVGGWGIVASAHVGAIPAWAEQWIACPRGASTAALALLPILPALQPPLGRRLAVIALAVIVVGSARMVFDRYRSDRADLVFVSVGQGDATIARLPGGAVLVVDGGAPGRGRSVVEPLLRRMGIARIDYLVATHVQDDHWGGLPELTERFEIGEFWHPGGTCGQQRFVAFTSSLTASGVEVVDIGAELTARKVAGAAFPFLQRRGAEGWRLRALWPHDTGACDENDRSVVVMVRFGRSRVLLTGDIESAAEHQLARRRRRLRASVLKAPHHGSRTSSSAVLLHAVEPAAAVASSGAHNRYGFPHADVLGRYAAMGVPLYRTDRDGAVTVHAYRSSLVIESFAMETPRTIALRRPARDVRERVD